MNLDPSLPSTSTQCHHLVEFTSRNVTTNGRFHYFVKCAQTILIRPFASTLKLTCRSIKFLTWDLVKTGALIIGGHHNKASTYFERQYIKTIASVRDILIIPTVASSAFKDMVAKRLEVIDDLPNMAPQSYLSIEHSRQFDQYSSYLHGRKTFDVIHPKGIKEFAAESDGSLNTVMASHFLKPNQLAIDFGIPNVAVFNTESEADGTVQTYKVDAKSLKREPMSYHPTNGKVQSGIFFVPTNLPSEALERFSAAAKKFENTSHVTCVNTNCRVLKDAGFSIEGKDLEEVIFPTTFMEHLLFRNVFYTDSEGKKHKIHFDIINTTKHTLEEYCQKIDTAVLSTRLRHKRRNSDTEQDKKIRGAAARALIAEESSRLSQLKTSEDPLADLTRRKVTVSVPSCLGDAVARIWGRHTIYEVDFSDKQEEIAAAFQDQPKLPPFPHAKPSLATRIKRDFFFSKPLIQFLRRHIMGRRDTLFLDTRDLFNHLKSTNGERLNYVVIDNKVVLAKVHSNGDRKGTHRKLADWALSKHALLAKRSEVNCSGEMWYDQEQDCFMVNRDSGTYMPSESHLKAFATLANNIFKSNMFAIA